MSAESQANGAYEVVLADLRAKRDQIDQAIQAIATILAGGVPAGTSRSFGGSESPNVEGEGAFLGMSIAEAAKRLLASKRRQLNNADIVDGLKAGGLHLTSKDAINTVGSVLNRRFNTVGDIVRVGRGTWGLQEWYPNRNFKKKTASKGEDSGEAGTATASDDLDDILD